ncbi:HNH endonuclease signature motif containing protein [Mycobacterium sp. BMJ-28]
MEGVGDLAAMVDKLSAAAFDDATVAELLEVQSALEQVYRRIPAVQHQVLAAVKAQSSPGELGIRSWADVLSIRLRVSHTEACRRLAEGELLGPRRALTGGALEAVYPATAAALARGELTAEHVRIITTTMKKIPFQVDDQGRTEAEVTLAAVAATQTPEGLRRAARLLLELLDPDGPEPNDDDSADRRELLRGLFLGPQDADGMSEFRGRITPEFRAYLEPLFAKRAAKGMCNPDDVQPCTTGTPSSVAVAADTRSLGQRQHDALMTLARTALASGDLGEHNGLPVSVVVSTTVNQLQDAAGVARTGGGSALPMRDLIRLASHSYLWLTVFDDATGIPLYLGRTKRIASQGQRIVLYARDRGCTFPDCSIPAYLCQTHHAVTDFGAGGGTDIDNETLACGPHNRLVKEGGWRTTINPTTGRAHWHPPPLLDTGQDRTNHHFHPEELLGDDADDP